MSLAIERIIIYLVLLCGMAGFAYYKGYSMATDKAAEETAKLQAEAFANYKAISEKLNSQSIELERAKLKTTTVYKTITNTVEREIHEKPILTTTRCFDDNVMRLFNADIADIQATDTGKPATAVRATASP